MRAALLGMASALALSSASGAYAQTAQAEQQVVQIDLEAGPLGPALTELGDLLGVSIFASNDLVAGKRAPAVSGAFSAEEALSQLLDGSGLTATPTPNGGFLIAEQLAQAEEENRPEILPDAEEVIVFGTKRFTRLQDSQVSTSVINSTDLQEQVLNDLSDILLRTCLLYTSPSPRD